MADIQRKNIVCDACDVHYLHAGNPENPSVVLLHGMKFQASTWEELGTLATITESGFQAIAPDMPGFGRSPECSAEQDCVLDNFLTGLGISKTVLLGPSMGGRIALEYALNHPERVKALILVGAVGVEENNDRLSSINVPTLLVWGSEDQISPLSNTGLLLDAIPSAKKIIIEGAPHPCYLDNPETWHRELTRFLDSLI